MVVQILLIEEKSLEHLSTTSINQKTPNRFNNSKIADWRKSIVNRIMALQSCTRGRTLQMSKTISQRIKTALNNWAEEKEQRVALEVGVEVVAARAPCLTIKYAYEKIRSKTYHPTTRNLQVSQFMKRLFLSRLVVLREDYTWLLLMGSSNLKISSSKHNNYQTKCRTSPTNYQLSNPLIIKLTICKCYHTSRSRWQTGHPICQSNKTSHK